MTKLHEDVINEAKNGGEALRSFDDNRPAEIVEVTYCKDSGKLMTDACRLDPRGNRAETGYFTVSTAPHDYCDRHVVVDYDTTTNAYAHEYTKPENRKKVALIRETTRAFPVQIYVEDAQYVYRPLPDGVRPGGWWGVPYFIATIPGGTYVGITNLKGGRQFNSFSYENYDFSRFESGGTATTTTEETAAETIPSEGDDNNRYEDG